MNHVRIHVQTMIHLNPRMSRPLALHKRLNAAGAVRNSSSSARGVMVPHCTELRDGHPSKGEQSSPLVAGVGISTLVQRVVMWRTVQKCQRNCSSFYIDESVSTMATPVIATEQGQMLGQTQMKHFEHPQEQRNLEEPIRKAKEEAAKVTSRTEVPQSLLEQPSLAHRTETLLLQS